MTGDSGLQFWFCFCSGDVHFLLCQGIGLNNLNDSELLTNKLSSEKQSWQPTPGSLGTSAAWPCPSQLMPPLKAAALLVEACCRHLLLDPPKRRWGQATPWFSSQTLVIILATSPLKTSGSQSSLLSEAEDIGASVLAQETSPNGLTSCGLGVWAGSGFGAQAWPQPLQTHPLPVPDCVQREIRETGYSPWEHLQKQDLCCLPLSQLLVLRFCQRRLKSILLAQDSHFT